MGALEDIVNNVAAKAEPMEVQVADPKVAAAVAAILSVLDAEGVVHQGARSGAGNPPRPVQLPFSGRAPRQARHKPILRGSGRAVAVLAIPGVRRQHDRRVRTASGGRAATAGPQASGPACIGSAARAHRVMRVAGLTAGPTRGLVVAELGMRGALP